MAGCARPVAPHLVVRSNDTQFPVDSWVRVTCDEGYRISGSRLLTCQAPGLWDPDTPQCEEYGSGGTNVTLIAVCTVASAVAMVVIVGALYMLLKNCGRERRAKAENDLYKQKMDNISHYFAVSQDFVGMPPLVLDNVDPEMKGRGSIGSRSSASSPASPEQGEETKDKVFIY